MATHNVDLSQNETQKIDPDNPAHVANGDTVNAHLHSNAQLTIETLDISMEVTLNGANSEIIATQGSDLTITSVTKSATNGSIQYKLDYESSITYIADPSQADALSATTFHYMGQSSEGEVNNESVGIVKLVLPSSMIGQQFAISNLQIGDKLLVEIDNGDSTTTVPTTFQFTSSPEGSFLEMLSGQTVLARAALPDGYDATLDYELLPDGTFVVACYLRDTLIATPDGQKLVQDLQPGDQVTTASGGVATVKWLGYRKMHATRIPKHMAIRAFPVRIAAGALAPSIPTRDLYVSPGHHMYFDGMLVPAMMLVNGKTITQDFSIRSFEYFHVELDHFDILLAEGAAAESYVDTGNRGMFQNSQTPSMTADFGPATGRPAIEGVEVLSSGPKVEALRKRLLKRAELLSKSARINDPDLRIEINGQEIRPEEAGKAEGIIRFVLPANTQAGDLRILSRSAVVRDTTAHARRDLRRVGVGLASLVIEDASGKREVNLMNERLQGFQPKQDVHGTAMRWTTGEGVIPAAIHQIQGPAVLELHVLRTYSYWVDAQQLAA